MPDKHGLDAEQRRFLIALYGILTAAVTEATEAAETYARIDARSLETLAWELNTLFVLVPPPAEADAAR